MSQRAGLHGRNNYFQFVSNKIIFKFQQMDTGIGLCLSNIRWFAVSYFTSTGKTSALLFIPLKVVSHLDSYKMSLNMKTSNNVPTILLFFLPPFYKT